MSGKIKLLLSIFLFINTNIFAQNRVDVILKPGETADKEIIISELPLSVTIKCDLNHNIDFDITNNSDKTLWFIGETKSYKAFRQNNKSIWTNKRFKTENDQYYRYIESKYNPNSDTLIVLKPGDNHNFHWNNSSEELVTMLTFYTSTYERKGIFSTRKVNKINEKLNLLVNLKIEVAKDPCETAGSYYNYLTRKTSEINTIIEQIQKSKEEKKYTESQAITYVTRLDSIKGEEAGILKEYADCPATGASEQRKQFIAMLDRANSEVALPEPSVQINCTEPINKIRNYTQRVDGLYLKIRINKNDKAALSSYKQELEKIKTEVETVQRTNPQCSGALRKITADFSEALNGAINELNK